MHDFVWIFTCLVCLARAWRPQEAILQRCAHDSPQGMAKDCDRSEVKPARALMALLMAFNTVSSSLQPLASFRHIPLRANSHLQDAVTDYEANRVAKPLMSHSRLATTNTAKEDAIARFDLTRRDVFRFSASLPLGISSAAHASASLSGYDPSSAATRPSAGRSYFPPLTPPLANRATYRYDLGRDSWALEQLLVFANVSATIRTIVVKMSDGRLWVNSPQWPTGEFCALLDELGPVGHVVLPVTALEHKAPIKAFVQKYPSATVWIAPGQYGPFGQCGLDAASSKMGYRVDGVLPIGTPSESAAMPPWASEFEMRTLYVDLPENSGPVAETAFLHKPTKSLITTDSVIFVPTAAPPIFDTYFKPEEIKNPDFWPKSVLQAVFLKLRYVDGVWPGYNAVKGRLLRAPILRAFADARAPDAVREWVRSIASMGEFDRILTSHFASPIAATPSDYLEAFNYLKGSTNEPPIACVDWELLDDLNKAIATNKLGAPVVYDFKQGCGDV